MVAALKILEKSEVTRLQEALRAAGQRAVAADGELGPQTEVALRRFQAQRGLSETGEPDEATLAALGLSGSGQTAAEPGAAPVTTWALEAELLGAHGDYASGVTRDFDLTPPSGAEERARPEWVDEVRTLYVEQKDDQLDDRKVLFGLALLDRELRGALGRPFVDALAHEITDLPGQLSGRGKAPVGLREDVAARLHAQRAAERRRTVDRRRLQRLAAPAGR